jgi:hypothetical protein
MGNNNVTKIYATLDMITWTLLDPLKCSVQHLSSSNVVYMHSTIIEPKYLLNLPLMK